MLDVPFLIVMLIVVSSLQYLSVPPKIDLNSVTGFFFLFVEKKSSNFRGSSIKDKKTGKE
jgi:hypothetical protein